MFFFTGRVDVEVFVWDSANIKKQMSSFKELGLQVDLLEGITSLGFETPTPVQQMVIPVALETDEDLIALAQTGTGKTAAFGLPLLQRIRPSSQGISALILCPTRELCVQVAGDLERYAQFAHHYKVVAVYGGASIETQIRQIRAGVHIVVATPGRLMDLLTRKAIKLDTAERVVLDEADEMLNMGFKEAVDFILESATSRKSVWLFSATMPDEVRAIARDYMTNPREITAGMKNQSNENIEHQYFICRADDRFATLKRVVDATPGIYGLIFVRTRIEAKEVAEQMIRDGYNSDALHGDLAQSDRDRVMQRFREMNLQLLIATDVAARGLDVQNISHVINYGLPDEIEVYTHRSGRTGRAGKTGISISIITQKYEEKIRQIERRIKAVFTRKMIPTGYEVCEQQLYHIVQGIHTQEVQKDEIAPFMPRIVDELKDLSKEDLIERFASVEFNRFLKYYRNAPDINIYPKGARKGGGAGHFTTSDDRGGNQGQQRLFMNVGEMDGVSRKDFVKLLSRTFGVPADAIGQVDISRSYMHFNLDAAYVTVVRQGLSEFSINGRRLRVDDADAVKSKGSSKEDRFFNKFNKQGGKREKKRW